MNWLVMLSTLIVLFSPVVYIRAILHGQAKPHRTTRLVILATTALTTLSLFPQHNTVAIWLSLASTIQAVIVFSLSLKFGMGGWAKIDLLCLFIATSGIAAWYFTRDASYGLYFGILADFTGMIPTLIKSYRLPHTEIIAYSALDTLAAALNLLAINNWKVNDYVYPLYLLLINGLLAALLTTRKYFLVPEKHV